MGAATGPISGRCLCGAVTFKADGVKRDVDICHCGMCRRWSGGLFMSIPHDGAVTFDGAENISIYRSSDWGERAFCKICGTSLFWRQSGTDKYAISAPALDDQSELRLTEQIFIDDKPGYYDLADDTVKLTGAEVMAAFNAGKAPE